MSAASHSPMYGGCPGSSGPDVRLDQVGPGTEPLPDVLRHGGGRGEVKRAQRPGPQHELSHYPAAPTTIGAEKFFKLASEIIFKIFFKNEVRCKNQIRISS